MNHRTESDEWLMGQVRQGDREALEKLVRRYASPLLTFIVRMIGDRHRAEELFQEVFLAVWTKRRQFKLKYAFRGWLFTIAANRCRSDFRKKQIPTAPAHDPATTASGETAPSTTAIATETASLVSTAVEQLPPQQRTVVVLRIWNGLSFREISEVVGTTESAARSNMHRGLQTMRGYLEPRLS